MNKEELDKYKQYLKEVADHSGHATKVRIEAIKALVMLLQLEVRLD